MAERVVLMREEEFDEILQGLDALPFDVRHTIASNGKFISSVITVSKSKVEASLKAMDYNQLKDKDVTYRAYVNWVD